MKLALTDLLEPVSAEDVAATRAFYANRPPRSAESSLRAVVHRVGDASVRVILPGTDSIDRVYLFIPPGGFFASTAANSDARNTAFADSTRSAVVTVDYRLAPHDPWPCAPDDCARAAEWLFREGPERFGTTEFVVGGMSAGSTLVVTTLLRLGSGSPFSGAVLDSGTYDLSGGTPAGRLIADEYFLDAYVGHVDDRTLPDISPIFGDLRGLPPTLLVIGSEDILLADNLHMAARLSAAGNDVDLRVYPAAPHGFTNHPTPVGRRARTDIADWITAAQPRPGQNV